MLFCAYCLIELKIAFLAVCENEQENGLYIQAFSRGLEQVLQPYQQTLVKLEAEVSICH